MDLSIIIVNWNSVEFLRKCLASVFTHTSGFDFEVIVIDSASFDGCDRMLDDEFPTVIFIQSHENLGFAGSNNRAAEIARGRNFLFLNPDTEIHENAFARMLSLLKSHADAGCVGCRLLNSDGTVQTSCIQAIPTIPNQFADSEFLRRRWPHSKLWGMSALFEVTEGPHEVEAISGACVMLRRDVWKEIGGFSEDFFMYGEDIDLSFRARSAGFRNYYVPGAEVVHHGGSSTEKAINDFSIVMMREAIWRFLRKTRGIAYAAGYRAAMFTSALCRLTALLLLWPGRAARQSNHKYASPSRKWWAVLRWSLHAHPSIRHFYKA
ncbi:MAG: glycosyltransferase family 2 protein [Opitutaceae bacterium]